MGGFTFKESFTFKAPARCLNHPALGNTLEERCVGFQPPLSVERETDPRQFHEILFESHLLLFAPVNLWCKLESGLKAELGRELYGLPTWSCVYVFWFCVRVLFSGGLGGTQKETHHFGGSIFAIAPVVQHNMFITSSELFGVIGWAPFQGAERRPKGRPRSFG